MRLAILKYFSRSSSHGVVNSTKEISTQPEQISLSSLCGVLKSDLATTQQLLSDLKLSMAHSYRDIQQRMAKSAQEMKQSFARMQELLQEEIDASELLDVDASEANTEIDASKSTTISFPVSGEFLPRIASGTHDVLISISKQQMLSLVCETQSRWSCVRQNVTTQLPPPKPPDFSHITGSMFIARQVFDEMDNMTLGVVYSEFIPNNCSTPTSCKMCPLTGLVYQDTFPLVPVSLAWQIIDVVHDAWEKCYFYVCTESSNKTSIELDVDIFGKLSLVIYDANENLVSIGFKIYGFRFNLHNPWRTGVVYIKEIFNRQPNLKVLLLLVFPDTLIIFGDGMLTITLLLMAAIRGVQGYSLFKMFGMWEMDQSTVRVILISFNSVGCLYFMELRYSFAATSNIVCQIMLPSSIKAYCLDIANHFITTSTRHVQYELVVLNSLINLALGCTIFTIITSDSNWHARVDEFGWFLNWLDQQLMTIQFLNTVQQIEIVLLHYLEHVNLALSLEWKVSREIFVGVARGLTYPFCDVTHVLSSLNLHLIAECTAQSIAQLVYNGNRATLISMTYFGVEDDLTSLLLNCCEVADESVTMMASSAVVLPSPSPEPPDWDYCVVTVMCAADKCNYRVDSCATVISNEVEHVEAVDDLQKAIMTRSYSLLVGFIRAGTVDEKEFLSYEFVFGHGVVLVMQFFDHLRWIIGSIFIYSVMMFKKRGILTCLRIEDMIQFSSYKKSINYDVRKIVGFNYFNVTFVVDVATADIDDKLHTNSLYEDAIGFISSNFDVEQLSHWNQKIKEYGDGDYFPNSDVQHFFGTGITTSDYNDYNVIEWHVACVWKIVWSISFTQSRFSLHVQSLQIKQWDPGGWCFVHGDLALKLEVIGTLGLQDSKSFITNTMLLDELQFHVPDATFAHMKCPIDLRKLRIFQPLITIIMTLCYFNLEDKVDFKGEGNVMNLSSRTSPKKFKLVQGPKQGRVLTIYDRK